MYVNEAYQPSVEEIEKETKGFVFCGDQINNLNKEEKSWLDDMYLFPGDKQSSKDMVAYFRLIIPIKPPQQMIGFLEKELEKCVKVAELVKADAYLYKFIDTIIEKYFGSKAIGVVTDIHDSYNAFLNYQYNRLYLGNTRFKNPMLPLFKSLGYNFFTRKMAKMRENFYRVRVELVREKLYPSHSDYKPPTNLRDWMHRIDTIREEYQHEKIDF